MWYIEVYNRIWELQVAGTWLVSQKHSKVWSFWALSRMPQWTIPHLILCDTSQSKCQCQELWKKMGWKKRSLTTPDAHTWYSHNEVHYVRNKQANKHVLEGGQGHVSVAHTAWHSSSKYCLVAPDWPRGFRCQHWAHVLGGNHTVLQEGTVATLSFPRHLCIPNIKIKSISISIDRW